MEIRKSDINKISENKLFDKEDIYDHFYQLNETNISSNELDDLFREEIKVLANSIHNLPQEKRNIIYNILRSTISQYIEEKVTLELNNVIVKALRYGK